MRIIYNELKSLKKEKSPGSVPAQRNTVLVQSSSDPCRSCHHNSSNTESALRHTRRSLCRCPSCPAPGKELPAWSILLAGIAGEMQNCHRQFLFEIGRLIKLCLAFTYWMALFCHASFSVQFGPTWHRSACTEVSWFVFICILSIACLSIPIPRNGCESKENPSVLYFNSLV